MFRQFPTTACIAATLLLVGPSAVAADGDFLLRKSFGEVLTKSDAVVIARRLSPPDVSESGGNGLERVPFQIVDVLKGDFAPEAANFSLCIPAEDVTSELFLVRAVRKKSDKSLGWRVLQPATETCRQHLLVLSQRNQSGAEGLAFFEDFLQHPDPDVSANAHLEFWEAADETFSAVCRQMDREKIVRWIKTPDVSSYRQRLYLAMLVHCGTAADTVWLREQVIARRGQPELDAWISCYLALTGAEGLPLVNRLYLSDPEAGIGNTYAAILALRFIADQSDSLIPKDQIVQSLRLLLDNRLMADLVVVELAYHQDWASLDRVVELFREADDGFGRMTFINYVRACPGETAKERLKEFEEIDPKSFRKARQFRPQGDHMPPRSKSRLRRPHGGFKPRC